MLPNRETIAEVNLLFAALIVVVVTALAVSAMLLVRRRAPEGSFFQDGDRAAGVFGVLATGFAVLVGFVVFLSFESYDTSRSGAETEAELVVQQFETAQFFPRSVRKTLSGEIVCYGRDVVHSEWPAMSDGKLGNIANPWALAMFKTLQTGRAQVRIGAGRLLEVVRPALGSRECARRSHARGGGSDPAAALDRALPQRDRSVPVHAALRRQRRARVRAGHDDRCRRDRHHLDPVAALVPRQPVSLGRRRAETGGDGADTRADRPRRTGRRRPRDAALRRARRATG